MEGYGVDRCTHASKAWTRQLQQALMALAATTRILHRLKFINFNENIILIENVDFIYQCQISHNFSSIPQKKPFFDC